MAFMIFRLRDIYVFILCIQDASDNGDNIHNLYVTSNAYTTRATIWAWPKVTRQLHVGLSFPVAMFL